MKRNKKSRADKRQRQKRIITAELVLFLLFAAAAGWSLYRYYTDYPAGADRESLLAKDRGTDYIDLSWDEAHNTDTYHIYYKTYDSARDDSTESVTDGTWTEAATAETTLRIEGLGEGEKYSFSILTEHEGHFAKATEFVNYTTRKRQKIKADKRMTKLTASKAFVMDADAETAMEFTSGDESVLTVGKNSGKVTIKGSGEADIKITAAESRDFTAAKKTVEVTVFDAYPQQISGASVNIFHHLDPDNCEALIRVSGDGGADVPQGLAYTGDRFMVTFGMYGPTRIVGYDTDGENRTVEVPKVSLGHPNGFTYSPDSGKCYCVRGRSNTCTVYDTNDGSYRNISLPTGASGISYDRARGKLCTSARKSVIVYDPETLAIETRYGVVNHSGTVYRQDCECYDGLMMHILSGSSKHGINYIDLYSMDKGLYIGTISCDLGEVESAVVDDDGWLVLLANGSGNADYIWKTDFNAARLAGEIRNGDY